MSNTLHVRFPFAVEGDLVERIETSENPPREALEAIVRERAPELARQIAVLVLDVVGTAAHGRLRFEGEVRIAGVRIPVGLDRG